MEEEVLAGMVLGVMFALPFGYFLRSAVQWRREARRALPPVVQPMAMPQPVPPADPRLERVLERLAQRLESVEDRIDFTEHLLDGRSAAGSLTRRDPAQR